LGYEVHTVASGEDALAYLNSHSADIILLDMIMEPGMDGLETYRRILKVNPRQRAIIASGYSETNRVKQALELGVGVYLRKPYTLKKLALAVRRELNPSPA
jgi:CheY-like chemotaxis protein